MYCSPCQQQTFAFRENLITHITELVSLITILWSSNRFFCSVAWIVKWLSDYAKKSLTLCPYSSTKTHNLLRRSLMQPSATESSKFIKKGSNFKCREKDRHRKIINKCFRYGKPDYLMPECKVSATFKCNSCHSVGHLPAASAKCQSARSAQPQQSSWFHPLCNGVPTFRGFILSAVYACPITTISCFLPGSRRTWSSWTHKVAGNRNGQSRPTPEMPLWIGPIQAPSDRLLLSFMPDSGASQTIVSLDAARRAKLKIGLTHTVL